MVRRTAVRSTPRKAASRRKRRFRLSHWLPSARTRRRLLNAFLHAPASLQIISGVLVVFTLWLVLNWTYQVFRKPSELLFPISGVLHKTPTQTWDAYHSIFRRHATQVITPELLAALAQVEGSGNPIVRTYWRWSLRAQPFEVYRPASSAVGMYQFTDGTFAEARRYCIHDHVVVEDGPWDDFKSCWFNALYTRVIPTHAVELASAYLDRRIAGILALRGVPNATLPQKHNLAAVIHLCGAGAGSIYARRGFRLAPGQRCGDHLVQGYIARVEAMKRVFSKLDATTDEGWF
jgi:hypothetical protein